MEPIDWNITIVGAWNPAIFHPAWIKRRLLELEDTQTVRVEITFDFAAAPRVTHDGIIVVMQPERLVVGTEANNVEQLRHASRVAAKALTLLPETPIQACGVNQRFRLPTGAEGLTTLTACPLDQSLANGGHRIVARHTRRTIPMDPGLLNIDVTLPGDAGALVGFNYHTQCDRDGAEAWMARLDEMTAKTTELSATLELEATA